MSLKKGDKRGNFLTRLQERQNRLHKKLTGEEIDFSKRKKDVCPVCFTKHYFEVPDSCWFSGLNTPSISLQQEFERYIYQNKKGRIV